MMVRYSIGRTIVIRLTKDLHTLHQKLMKLHLPKLLRNAVLACITAVAGISTSATVSAEVISINFSSNQRPVEDASGKLNGVGSANWNNISNQNKTSADLIDSKGNTYTGVFSLTLPTSGSNTYNSSAPDNNTVISDMQYGYIDLSANTNWSITLDFTGENSGIDAAHSHADLVMYFAGDGAKYAPVSVGGENYIGGTDEKAGDATEWGDRSKGASTYLGDHNTIRILDVDISNALTIQSISQDTNAKRATISGMQILVTEVYDATLTAGAHTAGTITWVGKDSFSGNLASIAATDRNLRVDISAGDATLTFGANDTIVGLFARGGHTLTVESAGQLAVNKLWTAKDTSLILNTELQENTPLELAGAGRVTLETDQTLAALTGDDEVTLVIKDGVQINVASYDFKGSISAGTDAALNVQLANGANSTVNGITVTNTDGTVSMDALAVGNAIVTAQNQASIGVASDGGTLEVRGAADTKVTLTSLAISAANTTTVLKAADGVTLSSAEAGMGQLILSNGKNLTVGKGVSLKYTQLADNTDGRAIRMLNNTTLLIDGGTVEADSFVGADAGSSNSNLTIDNGGLLNITGTDNDSGKSGSVCINHWQNSTVAVNITDGEFRALGAKTNIGESATGTTTTINIGEKGIMNTLGLRMISTATVNVAGKLNLGTTGIENPGNGSLIIDGGTLGALHADGWSTNQNITFNSDSTIQLSTWDVENKQYTDTAADIRLNGNLTGTGDITLAGSGSLFINAPISQDVHLAAGSQAKLALDGLRKFKVEYTESSTFYGYGDSLTDGYATDSICYVAGEGSTITSVDLHEGENKVQYTLTNGTFNLDAPIFYVNTEVFNSQINAADKKANTLYDLADNAIYHTSIVDDLGNLKQVGENAVVYLQSEAGTDLLKLTNVPANWKPSLTISGNTIEAAASNYTADFTVLAGATLKLTNNSTAGAGVDVAPNRTITLESGAVFDANGKKAHYHIIMEQGSSLINKGDGVAVTAGKNIAHLELTGDATIDLTSDYGLVGDGNARTKLTLNGNTLTKIGSGKFYFNNCTTDAGTIRIEDGTLHWFEYNGDMLTHTGETTFAVATTTRDDNSVVQGVLQFGYDGGRYEAEIFGLIAEGGKVHIDKARVVTVLDSLSGSAFTLSGEGSLKLASGMLISDNIEVTVEGGAIILSEIGVAENKALTINGAVRADTLTKTDKGTLDIDTLTATVIAYGTDMGTLAIETLGGDTIIDLCALADSSVSSLKLGIKNTDANKGHISVFGMADNTWELVDDGAGYLTLQAVNGGVLAVDTDWDLNWGALVLKNAPAVLPEANPVLNSNTNLVESVYCVDGVVAVSLGVNGVTNLGTCNPDTPSYSIAGGKYLPKEAAAEDITADVWIRADGGAYSAIVGGNIAVNYSGGKKSSFTGDTHIVIDDRAVDADSGKVAGDLTIDTVIGGNFGDGANHGDENNVTRFNGNTYVSIYSDSVSGGVIGASTLFHGGRVAFTGDSHVYVYAPLTNVVNGREYRNEGDKVVGGAFAVSGTTTFTGSSNLLVDMTEYTGTSTTFDKKIIGGLAAKQFSTHGITMTQSGGDVNLTILGTSGSGEGARQITFNDLVVGGVFKENTGNTTIGGATNVSITGGSYQEKVVGGTLSLNVSNGSTSHGDVNMILTDASFGKLVAGGAVVDSTGNNTTIGDISLKLDGVSLGAGFYGGVYHENTEGSNTSTTGDITIELTGDGTISGSIWAAGGTKSADANITVASTTVKVGNTVKFADGAMISGGFDTVADTTPNAVVTGARTLLFTGAYDASKVAIKDFTSISNAEAVSIGNLSGASAVTKTGAGVLTLAGTSNSLTGGLTVAEGGLKTSAALVLGGSLSLADGVSLDVSAGALTLAGNGGAALTLGKNLVLNAGALGSYTSTTLISGVSALEGYTGRVAASTYFASIEGVNDLTNYVVKVENGNLVLTELPSTLYWEGGNADWSSAGWSLEDGKTDSLMGFESGVDVYFTNTASTVTVGDDVTVDTMTVSGADYTFNGNGVISANGLEIGTGATASFTYGKLNVGTLSELTVDGTMVLGTNAISSNDLTALVKLATGAGRLEVTGHAGDPNACLISMGDTALTQGIGTLYVDGYYGISGGNVAGTTTSYTIGAGKTMEVAAGKCVRIQQGAKLVLDGGSLTGKSADSYIQMGGDSNTTDNAYGHIEIKDGGTLSVNKIESKGVTQKNTIVMSGGVLELTGTGGISSSGISTTITGGTVQTGNNSWSITGSVTDGVHSVSIGGATFANSVTGGTGVITLDTVKLTSALTVTGKVNFAGSITLAQDYTPAAAAVASYRKANGNSSTSGYKVVDMKYTLTTAAGTITAATGTTWSALTSSGTLTDGVFSSTDKTVTFAGAQTTEYWVRDDEDASTTVDVTYAKTDAEFNTATKLVVDGGVLQLTTGLGDKLVGTDGDGIVLNGSGTIDLAGTGVTLQANQVSKAQGASGTTNLTGTGVYDLGTVTNLGTGEGNSAADLLKVTLGEATWKGTVKLSGTVAGVDLDDLATTNSVVELAGVSGSVTTGETGAAMRLTGAGFTMSEAEAATYTFTGAVTGSGDMTFALPTNETTVVLAGNLSAWKGGMVLAQSNLEGAGTPTFNLQLTGGGTILDAAANNGVVMNRGGIMNLTIGNATKETTMNGAISNTGAGTLNLITQGKTTLEQALGNTGTGSLNLSNSGELTLKKDTTLNSLTSSSSITAMGQNLTVIGGLSGIAPSEGATPVCGSITAKSLTLQGSTNSAGALTLTGNLTLGTDTLASSLTATSLTMGATDSSVVINKLGTNLLSVTTLGSALDVSISDALLEGMIQEGTSSLKLMTLKDMATYGLTLNGEADGYDVSDGQYKLTLERNASGEVMLVVASQGTVWAGDATDADNQWSSGTNWNGSVVPGAGNSVVFDGRGSSTVVVNGDVTIENLTFATNTDTTVVPTPVTEYTLAADTGVSELYVNSNLAVNNGSTVNVATEVYIANHTRIANGATLTVQKDGLLKSQNGIENNGTINNNYEIVIGSGVSTSTATDDTLTNNGTFNNNADGILTVGKDINNAGIINNAGELTTAGELVNTGTVTATDGSIIIGIAGTAADTISVDNSGSIVIGGAPAANSGDKLASMIVNGGLKNTNSISIGTKAVEDDPATTDKDESAAATYGTLTVNGNLTNSGTLSVNGNGSSLAMTGKLTNTNGTITIDEDGSLKVNGDLDNTNGTITIGTASVKDNPDTPEKEAVAATTGSLTVTGSLTHSGSKDDKLVVNEESSLSVGGNLDATAMKLLFGGDVTVGGKATVDELTIDDTATFIAKEAYIGTLDNNGALTVGTLKVDTEGNAILDAYGNEQYEGGSLVIDSLSGHGNVTVGEGGRLNIVNSTNFKGELDNKGSIVVTDQEGVVTLSTKTDNGGVIVAPKLTISSIWVKDGEIVDPGTEGATQETANGSKLTSLTTNTLVFENLETTATTPVLSTGGLAVNTTDTDGKITIVLSEVENSSVNSTGTTHLLSIENAMPGTVADNFDLSRYGYVVNADNELEYDKNSDAVKKTYMQNLLAKGLIVRFSDTDPTSGIALLALGGVKNLYAEVDNQTLAESTWTIGKDAGTGNLMNATGSGLVVIKDTSTADGIVLEDPSILDNVRKVVVNTDATIDLTDLSTTQQVPSAADPSIMETVAVPVQINGLSGSANLTVKNTDQNTIDYVKISDVYTEDGSTSKLNGAYTGTLSLSGKLDATLDLKGDKVAATKDVVLDGKMTNGSLSLAIAKLGDAAVADASTLKLQGTQLNIAYNDGGATVMDTTSVADKGQVLVNLGGMTGSASNITIGQNGTHSALLSKYFTNLSVDENQGAVVADRNTTYYTDSAGKGELSKNGSAGLELASGALAELNPQVSNPDGGLSKMLTALDAAIAAGNTSSMDELGAALAGASNAVLGMAAHGDLDRQVQAIRNRTTTMGVDQSVVHDDMPYFNAWINAEGNFSEMSDAETAGGYKLNSWGGTVGFDVDFTPTFTAGMALTAMYGDLSVTGVDQASGDLNSYYVSAFARYCASAWTHTFVATVGLTDISMKRTVMGEDIDSTTDGMGFALMYEVGHVFALDEDATACLQPIFNITWRHTSVNGYDEKGSDLALKVGSQTLDTVTLGLGARMQAVVGESMYNRTSIFEARVLAKFDIGDRRSTTDVQLAGVKADIESAERGAIGLEAGAGLTIPLGDDGGNLFMDAAVELRADYMNVNGTVGYRINF